jgi:uncharacterized protein
MKKIKVIAVLTVLVLVSGWFALKADQPGSISSQNAHNATEYSNALAGETSPYLLQHAHNPVHWYPWGPEALQMARDRDLPIFLSVGYSACYWCHVMEREVFSNAEIAALMNAGFINIKVDREERPDIDAIYMMATQLISRHGGWPNSVFLTPDLEPFFAGTYFPPEDRFGRPGFPRVLKSITEAWTSRREEVNQQASQIAARIRRIQEGVPASGAIDSTIVEHAVRSLFDRYDPTMGGFSSAPKFPPDTALGLLLYMYRSDGDRDLLDMVTTTLDRMSAGGIHDHLGGGFHRYATDAAWLVPHFEKMLYNQALLASVYLQAYEVTSNDLYAETARGIMTFVFAGLTGEHGGFYTALDAETDAIEGLFYLWHEADIREILGDRSDVFLEQYHLAPMPEDSLGGVLHHVGIASSGETSPERATLLRQRTTRKRPRLDDKTIAGWNGLMISACAEAYRVLGTQTYLDRAVSAWTHIRTNQSSPEGHLYRIYRAGKTSGEAYQSDYAFVIRGLLDLYRATGEAEYLEEARRLQSHQDDLFWDPIGNAYFFEMGSEQLISRQKSIHDSAIPSGNAEAAHNLIRLAQLTGDRHYQDRAGAILSTYAGGMRSSPASHQRMILAAARYLEQETHSTLQSEDVVSIVSSAKTKPSGDLAISITVDIQSGWHINAHTVSDSSLIRTELVPHTDEISIKASNYPESQPFVAPFSDEPLEVYEGTLSISAVIAFSEKPDNQLSLRVQACDATRCLLPSDIPLSISVASKK